MVTALAVRDAVQYSTTLSCRPRPLRLVFCYPQRFETSGDIRSGGSGVDIFINKQNLAIGSDVESPTVGQLALRCYHTVGSGDVLSRVTQDWIVEGEGFGELLVRLFGVAARSKEGDIELPDFIAAFTKRLAFGRSATGKRFGKPGEDNRLACQIGKLIGSAVGAAELKIRRLVAYLQLG
jgi:hypothetical protein